MQNAISIFNFNQSQVRIQFHNGEPYFCLADVAEILQIKNANPTRFNLKEAGVHKMYISHESGKKSVTFINEPNLYRVIFRSNKPEAVKFQDWIFEEVIPQIRKTGTYSGSPKTTADDRTPLRQAVSALVGKKHIDYSDAYTLIHQRFGVAHIDELTHSQIPQAIEYLHCLILDKSLTGEILEKASQQTQTPPFDRVQLHDIIANMAVRLRDYGKLLTLFQRTPIADDKVCTHELRHLNTLYEDLMRLANDWQLKNTLGEPLFERNAINFYGGASVIW